MKKKHKWSTIILLSIFFVGLSVLLYPSLSSYWNSRTQSQAIVDYEKMLAAIPDADYSEEFARADEYNAALAALKAPLVEYKTLDGYMDVLNVSGTGIMGYISIEKIGVELPVYHTTNDSVLASAVGHLEGTSIPSGGVGTHSVLSAHRGLPSATLFTHLDHMEVGDTFTITILDRVLTYQVDQVKTIIPSRVEDIKIEKGKDYCTLLTCTPYGINTHRLLVRGVRIETISEKNIYVISDAYQLDPLIVMPAVAIPMLLILMVIVLAMPVKKEDPEDL